MPNRNGRTLKAVDFFCGGGGMSLGMRHAGIQVVAGIDNDPACRETYEANHSGSRFIEADITRCDVERLGRKCGIRRNDDRLVFIGCSPCQYWSIITGQKGSERKKTAHGSRNLLCDFRRFVEHYRPGFVVVENVRGIKIHRQASGLDDLLNFFVCTGYKFRYDVLSTNRFGVPQTRRRFILVASRVLGEISLPKPGKNTPTVRDRIGNKKRFPAIKAGECDSLDCLHKSQALSDTNLQRLKLTPEGGLREHWHRRNDLQIDAYRGKPAEFFRENYGRMAWNKPAPTITTRFYSIGCGRFGHPEENRAISLREGAALQTFPKNYHFATTDFATTGRLIGNAVPPAFARRIGASLVKQWRTSSAKRSARG